MNEHAIENGHLVGITQFDQEAVERALGESIEELEQFTPNEMEAGMKVLKTFLRWQWQNGNVKANGLGVRSAVLCWIFLEEVQSFKQSQLSKIVGKNNRQSINRWVINFRDHFGFKNQHMKSDQARENYKEQRS